MHRFYWTSTSHFDFGIDTVNETNLLATIGAVQNYNFDLNVNGLDPWQPTDFLQMTLDNGFQLEDSGFVSDGATSADVQAAIATNADLTATKAARISQMEGIQLSTLSGTVLGPTALISNLSVVSGNPTAITGTLTAPPKSSFNLDVTGSEWANLFNNSGPGTVTPYDTSMRLGVQPYFTGGLASDVSAFYGTLPPLFRTSTSDVAGGFDSFLLLPTIACSSLSFSSHTGVLPEPKGQSPILTDQNFGSLQYGDPFDAAWVRPFSFCERGVATISDASSGTPIQFIVADGVNTGVPAEAVKPLVAQVQNPMLNGQSLFTANSASNGVLHISWTAPQGPAPNGYMVQVFAAQIVDVPISLPPGTFAFTTYLPLLRAYTTKTSTTLPGSLEAGTKFLVEITALVDGRANFETSPLRLGLPQGSANVVSALMTVSGEAPALAQSKVRAAKSPYIANMKRGNSRTILFPASQ